MEDTAIEPVHDLYVRYAPDVYRLALSSTRDYAAAEDVVQEVFLRVLQHRDSFRGDSQVKTWIWRITKNCLVDEARRRTKHQKFISIVCPRPRWNSLESLIELDEITQSLTEQQRYVIHLRVIKDLSVADTAKLLQCSEGKVRTDTHRAISRIKESLNEGATCEGSTSVIRVKLKSSSKPD